MKKIRLLAATALVAAAGSGLLLALPAASASAQVSCAGTTLIPAISGGDVRVPTTTDGSGNLDCDLGVGNAGEAVSRLQIGLDYCNLKANLTVDGDYGPLTEAAVKAFEKSQDLSQDGVFGPMVSGRMQWPVAGSNNTQCSGWE